MTRYPILLALLATACADDPRPPDTVAGWVDVFQQPLLEWDVETGTRDTPDVRCTVTIHANDQRATVHPCPGWDPTRHSLHEILHVALAAAWADREAGSDAREEWLVDLLVDLILHGP